MNHIITSDGRFVTVGDDVLYHAKTYKYIKREKVNGKWRYWYDVPKETSRFETEKPISPAKSIQRQVESMLNDLPALDDVKTAEDVEATMSRISEAMHDMRKNLDQYELEAKGRLADKQNAGHAVSRAESDALKRELSDASNALRKLNQYFVNLNTRRDKLKNNKPKITASKKKSPVTKGKNWVETLFKD